MMPVVRQHHDRTVRLHYGPVHGRIVTLTESSVRCGYFLVPVSRQSPERKWVADFHEFADLSITTYHRKRLVTYDDVDDAFDVYDYWVAEGASLPKIGRIQ